MGFLGGVVVEVVVLVVVVGGGGAACADSLFSVAFPYAAPVAAEAVFAALLAEDEDDDESHRSDAEAWRRTATWVAAEEASLIVFVAGRRIGCGCAPS